jgi:hypothetical protein
MPVTILLPHKPKPCPNIHPEKSDLAFIEKACPKYANNVGSDVRVLGGTWKDLKEDDNILATSDSFVRGVLEAYARHMHLVLRPEEVWFAILTQMNFYMARNAEAVRHLFVSHQGQEDIVIEEEVMTPRLLGKFASAIQKRIKTPWLREWILPDFSTTTAGDHLTAHCLMMGLMQKYFHYYNAITCGIPSITLLGELGDWEKLLEKLDKMVYFGKEPAEFANTLRPILNQFVMSFIEPDSSETRDFWDGIVKAYRGDDCGGPAVELDGWIMDFFKWDQEGYKISVGENPRARPSDGTTDHPTKWRSVNITTLPIGYVMVPITIIDDCRTWSVALVAGGIAKRIDGGAPKGYYEALGRPVPGDDAELPTYASRNWPKHTIDTDTTSTHVSGCLGRLIQRFRRRQARISASPTAAPLKPKLTMTRKKVKVVKEFVLEIEETKPKGGESPAVALDFGREPLWHEVCSKSETGRLNGEGDSSTVTQLPGGSQYPESMTVHGSQTDGTDQDDHTTLAYDESRASFGTDPLPGTGDDLTLSDSDDMWHTSKIDLVKLDGPEGREHTTIQPLSGWMLFGNRDESELQQLDAVDDENFYLEQALYTSLITDIKEKLVEKKALRATREQGRPAIVIAATR